MSLGSHQVPGAGLKGGRIASSLSWRKISHNTEGSKEEVWRRRSRVHEEYERSNLGPNNPKDILEENRRKKIKRKDDSGVR